MARSLRQLPTLLQEDIDIVLEARDARLPLSGVNSGLASVVRRSWGQAQTALPSYTGSPDSRVPIGAGPSTWAGATSAYLGDADGKGKGRMRERVVVYTKRDLADGRFEEVSGPCVRNADPSVGSSGPEWLGIPDADPPDHG